LYDVVVLIAVHVTKESIEPFAATCHHRAANAGGKNITTTFIPSSDIDSSTKGVSKSSIMAGAFLEGR
jgi:hypothetical protein